MKREGDKGRRRALSFFVAGMGVGGSTGRRPWHGVSCGVKSGIILIDQLRQKLQQNDKGQTPSNRLWKNRENNHGSQAEHGNDFRKASRNRPSGVAKSA